MAEDPEDDDEIRVHVGFRDLTDDSRVVASCEPPNEARRLQSSLEARRGSGHERNLTVHEGGRRIQLL